MCVCTDGEKAKEAWLGEEFGGKWAELVGEECWGRRKKCINGKKQSKQ